MSVETNVTQQIEVKVPKQHPAKETTSAFKWFHASSLNGGHMLVLATIASYFSVYMTDTVGISTAAAAGIMFVATLWDAINDPIMGTIADRTNSKWGRYRPYFLFVPVIFSIAAVLLFLNPTGLGATGKVVYVGGLYILLGMCTTALTMPQMAVLPAVTKNDKERNNVITLGAGFTAVSFTVASTFTPQLTGFFGGSYIPLMVIYGLLTIFCFWGLFANSKERYITTAEKSPFTKDLKRLFKYKEIYPLILVWCLAAVGYGFMFASSVYFMMYYIGRPDLISLYMGIISIGALVSMVVLMPIALKIFKTGQKAMLVTQLITFVFYGVAFIFGENLILLYVCSFIATAFGSMSNALVNILVNDTIDFIYLKEKTSLNGTIASIKGFAQKCGNTITNSGILALLALSGYIPGAIGQQPDATMFTLNFVRFGIPAIICLVIVICMKYYPLEKYRLEIDKMKNG
ncbi:MFS transporter [Metabacillus halosaccharovorans]|uniref:MFS transporter n=1 Tax=Metabacillus halosaccharovorans TaxID=930124 RepID=UPI0034CF8634